MDLLCFFYSNAARGVASLKVPQEDGCGYLSEDALWAACLVCHIAMFITTEMTSNHASVWTLQSQQKVINTTNTGEDTMNTTNTREDTINIIY